ncbi:MAG: DUF3808 domain-containing protein [Promethearchaeota archaeon]|nr:MAG: DUF3808 domain-containing protein [Candidatus Lokiarchaeota archaeon]
MSLDPLLEDAKKSFNEGNIETALGDLDSAEKINSTDFRIYFYYGRCYIRKNEFEKAVEKLEKAYKMNPIGHVSFYLAKAYVLNDQFSKTVEFINSAFKLGISNKIRAGLNYFKAGALLELGKKEKSIKAAEKAAELMPENAEYQRILEYLRK